MRFLFTSLALCAVTMMLSGCASQLAGTCDSASVNGCGSAPCTLTDQFDCGCNDCGCDGACQAATSDGCCTSCGEHCGGRCGMKSRPRAAARGRIFGANRNQGCGGTGCSGCPDCGSVPAEMSGVYTGGFQACSVCGKPGCKGCKKPRALASDDCGGCGKFGCGQGGQRCLRCRLKNGMGRGDGLANGGDCGCESGSCGDSGCGWTGLGLGGLDGRAAGNHPFVDRLRAKGCGTSGCGVNGQYCGNCLNGGGFGSGGGDGFGSGGGGGFGSGGMYGGCGDPGCGVGGQPCANCAGGGGGMYGGCGAPGCGVGGQLCSNCLDRLYGGHLHQKMAHLLPAKHPYGGAIPHTELQPGMGGQAPAYAYPYYTTRGPRDFLQDACGPGPILPYSPRTTCLPSIGY